MKTYFTLVLHEWCILWRSPMWAKNIASLLFTLFGIGLMILCVPFLGYYFGDFLFQMRPDATSPLLTVGRYLPQYFIGTAVFLSLSLQLQGDVPSVYLLMPKMKAKMVCYLITKSLLHGFQRIFLLFFIPFALHYILPTHHRWVTISVVIGYIEIHLIVTLLVLLFKQMAVKSWVLRLSTIGLFVCVVLASKNEWLGEGWIGEFILNKFLDINLIFHATILLILVLLMDKNYKIISAQFTSEDTSTKKTVQESLFPTLSEKLPVKWLYLIRLVGYDNLKRPSFLFAIITYCVFMSLLIWLPHIFSNTLNMLMYFQLLASSLVVTVFPSFFTLSSSYMEGLQARKIDLAQLLVLHYRMILGAYFLLLILWSPLLYLYTAQWGLIVALSLFHAGFTSCVYLINAYTFSGRIELGSKRPSSGAGKMMGASILALFAVWLLTVFIYSVVGTVLGSKAVVIILAAIGSLFIATHGIWLREIIHHLEKSKYKVLQRYRAK